MLRGQLPSLEVEERCDNLLLRQKGGCVAALIRVKDYYWIQLANQGRKGRDDEIYNSQRSPVKTASTSHRGGRASTDVAGFGEFVN